MTAFRVDDGMYDHPKFEGLSDAALALWTRAGSWCGRYLNGGHVPADRVVKLGYGVPAAEELVSRGIWKRGCPPEMSTRTCLSCFHFHQWYQHQPSKDDVETSREKWREDKRRQRQKQKEKERVHGGLHEKSTAVDSETESRNGIGIKSGDVDLSSLSESRAHAVPSNDSAPPVGSGHQAEVAIAFGAAYDTGNAGKMPELYNQKLRAAVSHCTGLSRRYGKPLYDVAYAVCLAAKPGSKSWDFDVAKVDPYAPPQAVVGPSRNGRVTPTRGTGAEHFQGHPTAEEQIAAAKERAKERTKAAHGT